MPVTSPDNIYFSDTSAPADVNVISASEATSVQAAFALRQRYEFVWANAAARTAQTGMASGAVGYQLDTKAEYIYESSAWRLKLSYGQLNHASQSVPNATYSFPTPLTLDTSQSTDLTFIAGGTTGTVTFAQPGIYSISWTAKSPTTITSGFLVLTSDVAHTDFLTIAPWTSGVSTATLPFYRTSTANQVVYFFFFQGSGAAANISSVIRVGRLG